MDDKGFLAKINLAISHIERLQTSAHGEPVGGPTIREYKASIANALLEIASESEKRGWPVEERFMDALENPGNAGGLTGLRFWLIRVREKVDPNALPW